ncbi:MAG: preprotein translocase subunit YajC [Planctomycetota bacterium]
MEQHDTPFLLLPYHLVQEGERPNVNFGDTTGPPPAGTGTATTEVASTGTQLGGGAAEEEPEGTGTGFWLMLALLFGFMWFFVIRPENKRQKKRKEFQTALKKGDDVVTAGGLHGVIAAIDEQTITLKVSDSVRLKFDRVAVSRNASAEAEAAVPEKK